MKETRAEDILSRYDRLKAERSSWDTLWQDISNYVQPRMSQVTDTKTPDVVGYTDGLYNLTAVHANQILASGQMDYLFSGRWFSFDPRPEIENDDAKAYFAKCTDIVHKELARSNWTLIIHEMLLDRGGFGTASIMCEEGTRTALTFKKFDIGTYVVDEDHEGNVDTIIREFKLTARQAMKMFGEAKLTPKLKKAAFDPKKQDQKFTFINSIEPRSDYNRQMKDGPNKPIASCYVCREDRAVVHEGGYDEQAFAVSRYLRWGSAYYGYCPSIEALPTAKQVNFIEKNMDALAEQMAFPRVLVPDDKADDLDLAAGGVTTFDPNRPDSMPREWMTSGRYDVGKDRIEMKEEAIKQAYHVDLFQMLQQIERQMTAYEVQQRLAEKVTAFSPTFYRLQTEVTNPILTRIFSIMFRAGRFPEPPSSVFVPNDEGTYSMALPDVTLTSKLALAIKAAEINAFAQMLQILAGVIEVFPDAMDNYDLDKATIGVGRNLSVPQEWERSADERDAMRAARQQALAQQQAVDQAQGAARAAKDFSGASPDVKQAMMQQ